MTSIALPRQRTLGTTTVMLLMVRSLKRYRRTPMLVIFGFVQPILWMAMFSQSFRRLTDFVQFKQLGYTSYLTFFVPSILMLTMLNVAMQSGLSMLTDMDTGMLDKFLTSPVRRSDILLGRILADTVAMLVQGLIVLAIAFALGAQVRTGIGGTVAVLLLGMWLGICFSALSVFIALRTRSSETTMTVGMATTLPLLFLSSAFFPLQLQPRWVQVAAHANPVAYAVGTSQDLMNIGVDWPKVLLALGVLALFGAACLGAAVTAFRRTTG